MALPTVTINRTNGGIGRQGAGTDYYSGYVHYFPTGYTLPTGFLTNAINKLTSITDLVALGVSGNSSDETKSTATFTVTVIGSNGDTVAIKMTNPITGAVVTLGTYTKVSGDTTTTLVATAIAAAINAQTYLTGFTASAAVAVVTITAAVGFGAALNSGTPYSKTATGTIDGTFVQNVVAGVGSQYDVLYYHVREFFRMQGILNGQAQGILWVGCYTITASPSTYANFTEVATVQAYANGAIKQMAVYANTTAFATSHVTALQSQATTLQGQHMPLSIVYQPDISGTADVATLSNLRALTAKKVSVTIGQDGGAEGKRVFKALAKSVGCLGTALGAIALAKVNESILWREKFQLQDTLEYVTLAWANGTLQSASGSALPGLMASVDSNGYIFMLHEIGMDGAYFNNDHCAVAPTDDYAYIADNRTIDKAVRSVRATILPALGAPLTFEADGTLSAGTVAYFEELGNSALAVMQSNGEISQYKTTIDPTQNVQSTQNLIVKIQIIQRGVARDITVNIGFVTSLS